MGRGQAFGSSRGGFSQVLGRGRAGSGPAELYLPEDFLDLIAACHLPDPYPDYQYPYVTRPVIIWSAPAMTNPHDQLSIGPRQLHLAVTAHREHAAFTIMHAEASRPMSFTSTATIVSAVERFNDWLISDQRSGYQPEDSTVSVRELSTHELQDYILSQLPTDHPRSRRRH